MRSWLWGALFTTSLAGALPLGCGGADNGDLFEESTAPPRPALEPAAGGVRRLTKRQYVASVKLLLGEAAALAAAPPDDSQVNGFDAIGAAKLALSPAAIDQYETSANDIARAAVADKAMLAKLVPCKPSGP